jgi:hypothetical protein
MASGAKRQVTDRRRARVQLNEVGGSSAGFDDEVEAAKAGEPERTD